MERDQFNLLLSKYTSLNAEETANLISLRQEFPYSQVIQGMTARGAQDNSLKEKQLQENKAKIQQEQAKQLETETQNKQKL